MTADEQPSDLALLILEIDLIWGWDQLGRTPDAPSVVIAASADGASMVASMDLPESLTRKLDDVVRRIEAPVTQDAVRDAVTMCESLLRNELGSLKVSSGPSYRADDLQPVASDRPLLLSGNAEHIAAVRNRRPDNWTPDEWGELLAGNSGPWAMLATEERVVAVCHSARLNGLGAEAGTWTDPEFRGRGYAAATTAAWANLLAQQGKHLYYSTSADNVSSQRVAARLGLRRLGWLWKLHAGPEGVEN